MERTSESPPRKRARKRTSNACARCRQQKIKCSGNLPCDHCKKRSLTCSFDDRYQRVSISRNFLAQLQRQAFEQGARRSSTLNDDESNDTEHLDPSLRNTQDATNFSNSNESAANIDFDSTGHSRVRSIESNIRQSHDRPRQDGLIDFEAVAGRITPAQSPVPANMGSDQDGQQVDQSESRPSETSRPSEGISDKPEWPLTNPLLSASEGSPSFVFDKIGRTLYLGTSSNWAFGRRALSIAHQRNVGDSLPTTSLLFDGVTYDLGWDGRRGPIDFDKSILPTADYALFLINAVKFHCSQLYHLFDEQVFMREFTRFHDDPAAVERDSPLWYIHYLLILAFGKAFVVRTGKGRHPPGGDLFVQAMKLLPEFTTTFLCSDPVQAVEVLCCAALYLQCIDSRCAAHNKIGQALRIALYSGMHTEMSDQHLSYETLERCREAWWTVYVLDRQMSSLLGSPCSISDDDISACLPFFSGSRQKFAALNVQVKLSKATAMILQTVYGRNKNFLTSIKGALKAIAEANDERVSIFAIDLKGGAGSISRVSAYLHLFHHQCIILATRPLLFKFWIERSGSTASIRIPSSDGSRALMKSCVGSALQSLNILEALQSHNLLESFLPFDMELAFSSGVVLALAEVVDPSLMRSVGSWLNKALSALEEMSTRGNLIASYHRSELKLLHENLHQIMTVPAGSLATGLHAGIGSAPMTNDVPNLPYEGLDGQSHISSENMGGWPTDDGFSGEQWTDVVNSLDELTGLDALESAFFVQMGDPTPQY
ncbi:hypothetical protein K461DRAFT_254853 [Myriangium duriaei CBS 260.36]|uniref:Zn(2)-C6 fungal-type domain-containing protein n=1 Tax=Myriangium duriaei CBS 260.36 TaxID=1168546 RepID=A0A9P4J2I0_9PEZI|nr:hypothetical protein K461DRAFT_254853 [Myriangium duriaei CBS 260.36]